MFLKYAQQALKSPEPGKPDAMQSLMTQAPMLLNAYKNGEIDQRFVARTLGTTGFNKLLYEDMKNTPLFNQTMQMSANNPKALALAAQSSPFISEVMRSVRNMSNSDKLNQQKAQTLRSAQNILGQISGNMQSHSSAAQRMSNNLATYKKLAPRYTYSKDFKKEMERGGVDFHSLPTDVQERMNANIERAAADKGRSMSMFHKWSMTPARKDVRSMRGVINRETTAAQVAQGALMRAQQAAQRINNIQHRNERSIDSGKQLDLSFVQDMLPGSRKAADLIDVLTLGKLTKKEARYRKEEGETAKKEDDPTDAVNQYLNYKLRGVKPSTGGAESMTLVDTVRSILDDA